MKLLLGLADRSNGFGFVRGELVRRLQEKLAQKGFEPGTIDGLFGNGTARAVKAWQKDNGRAETGNVSQDDWQAITDEGVPSLFERCLQVTAAFEGHGFGLCKGNFDGALLTWGVIGFTLLHGEIQAIVEEIDQVDPDLVGRAFGDLEESLREGLAMETGSPRQVEWVNAISAAPFDDELKPPWERAFEALGAEPAVRGIQLARARGRYWETLALRDGAAFGMRDDLGLALCFDIAVQCGGVSSDEAEEFRRVCLERGITGALERRVVLADVVAENSKNEQFIEDVRARKRTMATGAGRVHRENFDLSLWGLAESEAAPAEVALTFEERFAQFFRTLAIVHFVPSELLILGSSHFREGDEAFGKNTLPPENLWPGIGPTIRILDWLRDDLGAPVRTLSVYRSPAYNDALPGAAPDSQHLRFTAIDFTTSAPGTPTDWARKLDEYRRAGDFRGGIGVYGDKGFVHVDTRGENRNFGPDRLPD